MNLKLTNGITIYIPHKLRMELISGCLLREGRASLLGARFFERGGFLAKPNPGLKIMSFFLLRRFSSSLIQSSYFII